MLKSTEIIINKCYFRGKSGKKNGYMVVEKNTIHDSNGTFRTTYITIYEFNIY